MLVDNAVQVCDQSRTNQMGAGQMGAGQIQKMDPVEGTVAGANTLAIPMHSGTLTTKTGGQMVDSFGISFVMIVILLVVQYNGWMKPLIILATLPLATIGALFGLWVTGNAMGFMPQLGLLSLFGIVLNTGIIFIEFADIIVQQRAKPGGDGPILGLTRAEFRDCLVDAGKQRMLPIFLTTATTIGGLLPLALAAGPLWEGMAWCMIFGLLGATLLTLLVVPALYAILIPRTLKSPSPIR